MEYVLNYETEQVTNEDGNPVYRAWLTSRPGTVCCGDSEHEAIASLIFESVLSGWQRKFNPKQPGLDQGMTFDPIQQAVDLLTQALAERVKERGSMILYHLEKGYEHELAPTQKQDKARLSELIGNLGTAIAALSRVKHD